MLTVTVSSASGGAKRIPAILRRVRIEYAMKINPACPFFVSYAVVPGSTNLQALARMLELWSIKNDNFHELADEDSTRDVSASDDAEVEG